MKKKLLLIGAGPTSSLIAYNIRKCESLREIFEIYVWEKAKGTGGRFSTSRSPTNANCYADLGAQYLTWSGLPSSKSYFDNLLENQLLRPFDTSKIPGFRNDPTKTNYVCSSGTASVVKHFFGKAGESNSIAINFSTRADGVYSKDGNKIEVSNEQGQREVFDFVVSTMPIPQLLQLKNIDNLLEGKQDLKTKLNSVKYTARYAMGIFYDSKDVPFQKNVQPINFVENDPVIRYWSVENKKRAAGNNDISEPCSLVIHTSTDYGKDHIEETPDSVKAPLMEKVKSGLKVIAGIEPAFIKCHKWRYSQVDESFPGAPGFVEIVQNFIVAGDGMTQSGLEGCITSAEKAVELLKSRI